MGYLVMAALAALLGYLAGLLSFKVKSRWCAACGAVKSCPSCAGWVAASAAPFDVSTAAPRVVVLRRRIWTPGAG